MKSMKKTALPRLGSDESNALISLRIYGKAWMLLRGLSTRKTRSERTLSAPLDPMDNSIKPVTTTTKSNQFHVSRM